MIKLNGIYLLFILVACLQIGYAQSNYHLNVTELSFEELLDQIESQLDVKLAYNSDLSVEGTFSFNLSSEHLEALLQPVWQATNLESQYVEQRQVLIRPKPKKSIESLSYQINISDTEDGAPLDMVAVIISGTPYGSYTNRKGSASLMIDKSDVGKEITCHLLGYDEATYVLADQNVINVTLEKSKIELDEIIIADRRNILNSDPINLKQKIDLGQLSQTTSGILGSDILRTTQLLSGISAHSDRSAGLQIRGSDDDQALIIVDGIPIYNPTHYFGVFSAINSSYIDQAAVYKNNLPIEYGGKTSGMLQLQSDQESELSSISGVADLNLLTSSLVLKIPISQSVRLLLNGRTTYNNVSQSGLGSLFSNEEEIAENIENFSLFTRDQILSSVPDYKFNDWNAKLQFKPSDHSLLDINFYQSNDELQNSYSNTFQNRRDRQRFLITENFDNVENWSNRGASLNFSSRLDQSWTLTTNAYYSSFNNVSEIATSVTTNNSQNPTISARNNGLNNYIDDYGTKVYLDYDNGQNLNFKAGVDFSHKESALDIMGEQIAQFNNELSADIYSGFGSVLFSFNNGWSLNSGIRVSHFSTTGQVYFSPRVNIVKNMSDNVTIKASAGRQYQFAKELSFETPQGRTQSLWVIGGSEEIPINKSNNFMLGSKFLLGRLALDIEGFYRTTKGVNEYAFFNRHPHR